MHVAHRTDTRRRDAKSKRGKSRGPLETAIDRQLSNSSRLSRHSLSRPRVDQSKKSARSAQESSAGVESRTGAVAWCQQAPKWDPARKASYQTGLASGIRLEQGSRSARIGTPPGNELSKPNQCVIMHWVGSHFGAYSQPDVVTYGATVCGLLVAPILNTTEPWSGFRAACPRAAGIGLLFVLLRRAI